MPGHRITVTPSPGAVFLHISVPTIEMTPGEALRLRAELDRAIGIALAAADGQALLWQIPKVNS